MLEKNLTPDRRSRQPLGGAHALVKRTGGIVTLMASERARRAVRQFIAAMATAPVDLESIGERLRKIKELDDEELLPAFAETMGADDPAYRFVAAWTFLQAAESAGRFDAESTHLAETIVLTALSDADSCQIACEFLRRGGVRPAFRPRLRELMRGPDSLLGVLSAAALAWLESDRWECAALLRQAMANPDTYLAGVAAASLLHWYIDSHDALPLVRRRLELAEEEAVWQILSEIKVLGPRCNCIADLVADVLHNPKLHPAIRRMAASTLERIGSDRAKVREELLRALSSSNWEVVEGALEGLIGCGGVTGDLMPRLAELLHHTEENMRRLAAIGFRAMAGQAQTAVPQLIERLAEENSIDICATLAEAIAGTGHAGLDRLFAVIRQGDVRTAEPAMRGIRSAGKAGARAIADRLEASPSEFERRALVACLCSMGSDSEPAVTAVGRELDCADDAEAAIHCAMCIYMCGEFAVAVIPSLVRAVLNERLPEQARLWAGRALVEVGAAAEAPLMAAMQGASEASRDRLRRELVRVRSGNDFRFSRFLKVAEKDLQRFVWLAEVLEQRKLPTGYEAVADILNRKGASAGNLRLAVGRIRKQLHIPLISTRPGQKGMLTPEATRLVPEVRAYLQMLCARREYADLI